MKVIINYVLARDYALGQIQHIPEMAFIWSLISVDLHMPNKIGMSKNNDSFGLIMGSSKVTGKVNAVTPPL